MLYDQCFVLYEFETQKINSLFLNKYNSIIEQYVFIKSKKYMLGIHDSTNDEQ